MKVAISSRSFGELLAAGELTQLEWLAGCASALEADGVVFDRTHFPRTDLEYVAQLRKIAVDVGLVPLAIEAIDLFAAHTSDAERERTLDLAAGIGALFVLTGLPRPGDVPPATFVAAVTAAKGVVNRAKAANVTLLARAEAGTLGADVAALRRFGKDVDSAWLRFALPADADRSAMGSRDRALVVSVDPNADLDAVADIDEAARPWLLLTGAVSPDRVNVLRRAAAKKTLAIAGVS